MLSASRHLLSTWRAFFGLINYFPHPANPTLQPTNQPFNQRGLQPTKPSTKETFNQRSAQPTPTRPNQTKGLIQPAPNSKRRRPQTSPTRPDPARPRPRPDPTRPDPDPTPTRPDPNPDPDPTRQSACSLKTGSCGDAGERSILTPSHPRFHPESSVPTPS